MSLIKDSNLATSSPKMSFILPVYNVEPYLARCLDSILAQAVSKEVIIVNDGSQDGSLNIARQYFAEHACITLVEQSNQGVSAARNAGLRLAKGEYVYFVDPDDRLMEPHLDKMAELADQYGADICKGLIQHSYEDGRQPEIRPPESPNIGADQYEVMDGISHLHQMLARDWLPSVSFGFFRTAFLRENGIVFPEGIRISEDGLFMLDSLICRNDVKVIEVGRVFYNYHHRPNSTLAKEHNIEGFISLFVACDILWEKLNAYRQKANAVKQVETDILRVIALGYNGAYRFQYLRYDAAHRQQVRHYFTPQIIALMEQFLGYRVVL